MGKERMETEALSFLPLPFARTRTFTDIKTSLLLIIASIDDNGPVAVAVTVSNNTQRAACSTGPGVRCDHSLAHTHLTTTFDKWVGKAPKFLEISIQY